MKTIFVSSTFKDMHFERDAIQEITLPMLKNEAIKYGESISFCDLRWGINTGDLDSEEGSAKVLDVCLDEIDRCKPPMVIILGDRYGWIPDEKLLEYATEKKNIDKDTLRKDLQLKDLQISVTALEIVYGALLTPERRNKALFYFRNIESDCPGDYLSEDDEHKKKLDFLKAKIYELTNGRIKNYTVRWNGEKLEGVIPFAEMLAEDIKAELLPEWKQKELLTPFERERLTHWSFIEEKNAMFSARGAMVQKFFDDLTQKGKNFLAIKAPSGSGKSMLFSNLALKLRESGYDVVPFMSGLTSESNDSIDILSNTIYYMEDLLGFSHESVESNFKGADDSAVYNGEEPQGKHNGIDKLRERLLALCVGCEQANKRVVIMVDAVDQLTADDNRDNLIFIPERLSDNVKFVITCLPELDLVGQNAITLKPMDNEEKRLVVSGVLQAHHRQIEDYVIEHMLELKASDNPLFLSLLIQRLLMMNYEDFFAINAKQIDAMKAISERQMEVLQNCPDSLQDMSAALMTEAGKRINNELICKVIEYIAISRRGLRKEDLAVLLGDKWSELDFTHFIAYLNESFVRRDDGRIDFSHKCIREGILNSCASKTEIHRQLIHHFQRLAIHDELKNQETVYHCLEANDMSGFVNYVVTCHNYILQNSYAMKDIYDFSVLDDGKWVCFVLSDLNENAICYISEFISLAFDRYGTSKQMMISKKILKKNIESITDCKYSENNVELILAGSLAYYRFAELCGKIGDGESWQDREEAYTKSIAALNDATMLDNSIDIRFELSKRFESIGNLYKEHEDTRNDALDYYKKAITIREVLLSETASNQYRAALSNAYVSIGTLYSMYTSNNDYLWRAVSYFEQAVALTGTTHTDLALIEQQAIAYHFMARVYCREDTYDKNTQVAYDYFNNAITYYEKLLWKSSPEYVWMALLNCYYEKADLLISIVKKIDEKKSKTTELFRNFQFDSKKRNEYIHESLNSFHKVSDYYDKLEAVDYCSSELTTTFVKALYMLAGATVLLPDYDLNITKDYLARGKEGIRKLEDTLTDVELFLLYYKLYIFFISVSEKNSELQAVSNEFLTRMKELLPSVKSDSSVDKEDIMLIEMTLDGLSKQYGKMLSHIPSLFFGAFKEGLTKKKQKLRSRVRNNSDKIIRRKAKSNVFAQQDRALLALIFGVLTIIGNCMLLPLKYIFRLLTPFLLKISGNPKYLFDFTLWYDNLIIFLSLIFLCCGLFACFCASRSKKSAIRIAIVGLSLSIVSSVIVLLSLNSPNYFQKQYNSAVDFMDVGKYEEAIEVFESLHDYEDSLIKIEECNTAILEENYDYAIGKMNENHIIEAYERLIELNGYKDSADIAKSIYDRYKNELLQSAEIGDCVYFGVYEQDNINENGKENIEWIVLDISDNKLLLISKYVLDCQAYNDILEDVTWETSTLRHWLNFDFINAAFSVDELAMISTTMVIADDNPRYDINQGVSTQDQLFMLSIKEARKYFDSNDTRQCQATNYAKSLGATRAGCAWWLRTGGRYHNYASHIWAIGGVNDLGVDVNESDIGVRPAMWIEREK